MDTTSLSAYDRPLNIAIGLLVATVAVSVTLFLLETLLPVRFTPQDPTINVTSRSTTKLSDTDNQSSNNSDTSLTLSALVRDDLFKSPTPLRDKPLADKTVDKIKSKLKLQCVMEMNGELTAYIDIAGVGFKQCRVGDTIEDLFTVLNITKNNVQISIVDHTITLKM